MCLLLVSGGDIFFFFHRPNATVHYIDFLGGTSDAAETLIAMTIHHSRVITVGIFIMPMPNAWAMTWHWPRASWLFDWLVTSAVEAGSGQFWIADRHYLDCLATMMCRLTRHMDLHTVLYVSSTHLPIMLPEVQMFGFNTHWSVAGESIKIGLHHNCVCQMLTESKICRFTFMSWCRNPHMQWVLKMPLSEYLPNVTQKL